ncbi:unnamed protein product [Paramecium sonneborni]|uniref:TLDc domain-containing protein n=1 Tax=Paramecium sonneborni TaxID=65129 RepID=A0A8S1REN5_9CILI|nr:unnamed protein product [Paramecium sonneborni]
MSIPCLKHVGSRFLYINYSKEKAEYQCELCLEMEQEKNEIQNNSKLIHIRRALNSPEYLLVKLNLSPFLDQFFKELNTLDETKMNTFMKDIENKILNLQNALQAIQKQLAQNVNWFQEQRSKIRDELKKVIKFEQFIQFTTKLEQLGDSINPQAIEQNEKQLHEYLQDLTKNNSKDLNNNVEDIIIRIIEPSNPNQKQLQIQIFDLQLDQFKSSQIELQYQIDKINLGTRIGSCVLQRTYSMQIDNQISSRLNKKIKSFQKVYQGSKDGLNGQTFWNKINGKSNLLMIFKSKSGNIFGGFSLCQWQLNEGTYVQDNTISSFLFSQTHNQIYPLKEANKQYAIYCNQTYGAVFGGGHDIYIRQDFNGGYSNLGHSYQWDQYQNVKSTHLFGQQTPNIVECEIFQVIFA